MSKKEIKLNQGWNELKTFIKYFIYSEKFPKKLENKFSMKSVEQNTFFFAFWVYFNKHIEIKLILILENL